MIEFRPIVSLAAGGDLRSIYGFGDINNIGEFITVIIPLVIIILMLIVFYFVLYGGFRYLVSGGNKENIAQARQSIVHAIIGLAIFFFLFLLIKYILDSFGIQTDVIKLG